MNESIPFGTDQLGEENRVVITALNKIRMFSIVSIAGFVLDLAAFAVIISFVGVVLKSLSSPSQFLSPGRFAFIAAGFILVIAAILLLVSFVYLRSGYKLLKKFSERFESPYTGINLYFSGLILAVIGGVSIFGVLLVHSTLFIFVPVAIIIIGGIMSLIGQILGLIVGSFRLRDYFKESKFSTAGIMFILGLFFSPFALVGSILIYLATNTILERIK